MFLDILLLFQHAAGECTGCMLCWFMWLLLPFLLGLGIGYWIWGKYKDLIATKEKEIAGVKTQLTTMEKDYMDLKYKMEQADKDNTTLRRSLADCQSTKSSLIRKLQVAESSVKEVPTERLGIVAPSVEEVVEEKIVTVENAVEEQIVEEVTVEEVEEEVIVEETPIVKAAAPLAVVGAVTTLAATSDASSKAVPASVDKEDDYLTCKEYIGHAVNDKRNNIALFKHSNGQYYFVLYSANGTVRLRSEGFRTSQERDKELSGVIRFKNQADKYKRLQKGKYYMDALYDDKDREVGRSCLQKMPEPEPEVIVEEEAAITTSSNIEVAAPETVVPEVVERQIIKVKRTVNISGLEDLDGIDAVSQSKLRGLGLGSMTALAAADEASLAAHFAGTTSNWRYWWNQAKYATNGEWANYYGYQANKGAETETTSLTSQQFIASTTPTLATTGEEIPTSPESLTGPEVIGNPPAPPSTDITTAGLNIENADVSLTASEVSSYGTYFATSNLQIIEGVGPKLENILKNAGYTSWGTLASTTYEDLKKMLSTAGPRYRIHDPKSWSRQAQLASENKWQELIDYQKYLSKTSGTTEAYSKVEKLMDRNLGFTTASSTDLKIIEGVGPKIEGLLKAGGIYNWTDLSNASVDKLKLILQNAGSRYRLADPTTWPTKAGMAVRKDWTKLKEYQDLLQGGKNIS